MNSAERHLGLQPRHRHRRRIRARPARERDDGAGEDVFAGRHPGKDVAGVVDFAWKSDRFNYGGQYLDVGERFNAEMGYIPRLDIRAGKVKAQWTPRPKWGGIRQLTFNAQRRLLREPRRHRRLPHAERVRQHVAPGHVAASTSGTTREYDNLTAPFATAGTTLPVGTVCNGSTRRSATTPIARSESTDRSARDFGGYYNGDRQSLRANLTLQVGKTLLFEPQYVHNRVTLAGRPLYTSNVLNFRVSHSFSPDFYLKGFVQYNDDRKTASFNFLWWYHYKPGSDLVCGLQPGLGHRSAADLARAA